MKVITYGQLLNNPSGPYSSYFARRDLIKNNLKDRFIGTIKKRKIKMDVFSIRSKIIFVFNLPSETFEKLRYDVVIEFVPVLNSNKYDYTINNYGVKLFSNSPNFMFTYAYIYNQDGILVKELTKKIDKKALMDAPVIKNPHKSYGFEKSVYFCLLYIKENFFNIKSKMPFVITDEKLLKKKYNEIMSCSDKLKEYNKYKKEEADKKREEKKLKKKETYRKKKNTTKKKRSVYSTRKK